MEARRFDWADLKFATNYTNSQKLIRANWNNLTFFRETNNKKYF
jgi:hypothetical protein